MVVQIPLDITLPVNAIFANFKTGENDLVVSLLKDAVGKISQGETLHDKQLLLWGEQAVGKTHLLQATCTLASKSGLSSCYLPMAQVKEYGAEVFQGLDQLQLVCLDDIDEVLSDQTWEVGLFNLINECRQSGTLLVLSACSPAADLPVQLKDLQSRLSWGAIFQLQQLGDTEKIAWLTAYAAQQGLVLQSEVAQYLLSRQQRDMHTLVELIRALDYASMSEKRKLTLPFVKSVINKQLNSL